VSQRLVSVLGSIALDDNRYREFRLVRWSDPPYPRDLPLPADPADVAKEVIRMAVETTGLDVALLKSEIRKTYASVSREPEREFIFPRGRDWARDLGYPAELLARVPEGSAESFAGVANPFSLEPLAPGERVLDLGCGAGTDTLVAAQMVGPEGHVTGIDMTPEMLAKARASLAELELANVELVEGEAESLPFPDETFDVVISNGVIDLIPDKDAVFAELFRVLRPGGRVQIADVTIQRPVSEQGRRNIDLWTG
jgi:SAM-dependent methyltransferase